MSLSVSIKNFAAKKSEKKKKKKKIHSASKLSEQIGFSVLKIVRSGYQRCLKQNFLKILQYFSWKSMTNILLKTKQV